MDSVGVALCIVVLVFATIVFKGDPSIHDLAKQWIARHAQECVK